MRAVVISEPGSPTVLEIGDAAKPEPRPGGIRVRVRAFALNRADLLQRRGLYPAPPGVTQEIPGLEYAGEVDALGDGVQGMVPGDRVMGIVAGGAYAEYLVTPADHAVCIPQNMTFQDAAAVPEVFVTAHDALERLGVVAAEWVLVHAIGSGVGTAALQLIRALGARCVGTSRTEEKLVRARTLGMEHGVNTSGGDFVQEILRVTGEGTAAAIDLVGGPLFPQTLECMASRGRVIVVGLTAGRTAQVDLGVILRKRLKIEGTVLRSRGDAEKTRIVQSFRDRVLPLLAEGRVGSVIDRVFSLEQVQLAHEYLETNANFGKVVVQID